MQTVSILQIIADFNFLLFAFLIWYFRKKLDYSIFIFSFFLFGKGIALLSVLITDSALFENIETINNIGIILGSFLFFYPPFLFLTAKSILKGSVSLKAYRFHFVPFFVLLIINSFVVILPYSEYKDKLLFDLFWLKGVLDKLVYIQVIGYTLASFLLVNKHKSKSTKHNKIANWLKKVLILFLFIWLLFWSNSLAESNSLLSKTIITSGIALLLILSNTVLFLILKSPEYFYNNLSINLKATSNNEIIIRENYDKLCSCIFNQKLYKNPDLKIGDLSEVLGLSARNTSTLINTFSNGNFYDFINSYRIEEAKVLLENEEEDVTILAILYEAGFNSKSVFNTVFKKMVGVTPSFFRKKKAMDKYG